MLSWPSRDCNEVETKKEGTREWSKQSKNRGSKEGEGSKKARKATGGRKEIGSRTFAENQKCAHLSDKDVALKQHMQVCVFCHRVWCNCAKGA